MAKRYLTLDDLYTFCKKNNLNHFSAKDAHGPIIVHTPGQFEASDTSTNGLLPVKLQACHTGTNRNKSHISMESMTNALSTFSNRPILGFIHQLDDGTWDFYAHNVEFVEDEDGNADIEYLEVPVGIIPESCNAKIVYDDLKEKNYVNVNGYIFEEYSKAAEILRAKGTSKVSVEIAIEDMSWNTDEDCLNINSFYFTGVTILGRDEAGEIVEEGMAGSNITLGSFSQEENSFIPEDLQLKMVETLTKLNNALDRFNNTNDSDKKGGNDTMDKFNELLEQYGLTVDEIDFEYDGLSDEELESLFTEKFGDAEEFKKKKKCSEGDDESNPEPEPEPDKGSNEEGFAGCKKKRKCSINTESGTVEFELSFDDIRMALYGLLAENMDEDSYAWICETYDDYFIYQKESYNGGYKLQYFKQGYSKDGENVSFNADPVEVFTEFVTESERTALDMIRSQYEELKAFKENVEKQELKVQKDVILESAEYADVKDSDEFKTLVAEADKYSVDEIKVKADLIFAAAMKKKFNFEAEPVKNHSVGINFNAKPKKKTAYGNLFDD